MKPANFDPNSDGYDFPLTWTAQVVELIHFEHKGARPTATAMSRSGDSAGSHEVPYVGKTVDGRLLPLMVIDGQLVAIKDWDDAHGCGLNV